MSSWRFWASVWFGYLAFLFALGVVAIHMGGAG